jgi:pyruvate kinase
MAAIAVFTETGNTARLISKYRPRVSIYAFSHTGPVCNRMNLFWGVHPVQRREVARSAEDMVNTAERELLQQGQVKPGDVLGVVAGTQMASGSTNFMRLHTVPALDVTSARGKVRSKRKTKSSTKPGKS